MKTSGGKANTKKIKKGIAERRILYITEFRSGSFFELCKKSIILVDPF